MRWVTPVFAPGALPRRTVEPVETVETVATVTEGAALRARGGAEFPANFPESKESFQGPAAVADISQVPQKTQKKSGKRSEHQQQSALPGRGETGRLPPKLPPQEQNLPGRGDTGELSASDWQDAAGVAAARGRQGGEREGLQIPGGA